MPYLAHVSNDHNTHQAWLEFSNLEVTLLALAILLIISMIMIFWRNNSRPNSIKTPATAISVILIGLSWIIFAFDYLLVSLIYLTVGFFNLIVLIINCKICNKS
ncbi:MAG: hypothetical protein OXF30_01655 [Candidatus Saccharibacteria bacterium]|nr:hypothetical protein [Candidatus Saccharibacteria bacterium]